MSTTKSANADAYSGWDEERRLHRAYQTKDDAENAIKKMANKQHPSMEWIINQHPTGLQIYNEDEDYSNDFVEFRVEQLRLMPAGCTERVKLFQESESEEEENETNDDEEEDEEDEVEIVEVRTVNN